MAYCFMDWETRSALDLTIVGGARYAKHPSTLPLLLSWAIDDGPVKLWVPDLSAELPAKVWKFVKGYVDAVGTFPPELHAFAKSAGSYWVAWNMAFDRQIAQHCATPRFGFPDMPTTKTLDAMAQAAASNLPGRLDMAGRVLGLGSKTVGGKGIMKKFADAAIPMPDKVDDWKTYLDYSRQDTALMRDIWRVTRPLDASEWQEYWVSEAINDRGLLADLDVCRGALKYRSEDEAYNRDEIKRLSHNEVPAVTMTSRINKWIYPRLSHELQEFVVKERNEAGEPVKYTLSKDVIGRLLEEIGLSDTPPEDEVVEVLELLQFGRSSSAVKFEKILNQADDGRLKGSYVFNGAGQTGRYCVAPDTLVDTPTGPQRIVDLRPGDTVITHADRPGTVTDRIYKGREEMYRLTGPNGEHLVATAAHRLLTGYGWLRLNDCFENLDGRLVLLDGCEPISTYGDSAGQWTLEPVGEGEVWDISVAGDESYRAQGCIHHNSSRGVQVHNLPRKSMNTKANPKLELDLLDMIAAQEPIEKLREYGPVSSTLSKLIRPTFHAPKGRTLVWGDWAAIEARVAPWLANSHSARKAVLEPFETGADLYILNAEAIFGIPSDIIMERYRNGDKEAGEMRQSGKVACIAEGQLVLTDTGLVPIEDVSTDMRVWDGEGFVQHSGSVFNGFKDVWEYQGLTATLDHIVWTAEGERKFGDAIASGLNLVSSGPVRDTAPFGEATYSGKAAVYDIVNAGPDHRFTVSGKLVHNCLALGFLGGAGALKAMARGYGMKLSNEDAQKIVDGWRARNTWARTFGDQCEGAAFSALNNPTVPFDAGLLQYVFVPNLLRGTLLCRLPDGRYISYPMAKIEEIEKFDKPTMAITYLNGAGRRSLWTGLQIENCTQATAASLLRQTLVRIESTVSDAIIVGHTHDEVICETDEANAEAFAPRLKSIMVEGFDWSKGLPLGAEVATSWYYHK